MVGMRVSTTVLALVLAAAIPAATSAPNASSHNQAPSSKQKQKSPKSKGLKRAAFRVTHASCVSCLRDIERTIRLTPGVKDVEVGIRTPYNSVVIYDSAVTSPDVMFAPVRKLGYGCVNITEVPAVGKDAVIARKEQKPAASLDTVLGID